jgi:dihydroflavonol-4-reductase
MGRKGYMWCETYLVTGGCGFLGQHVVKAINTYAPDAEIRVLDLEPRSTLLKIETIPNVKIVAADLRKPESFADIMEGVNTVVHCAGLISFRGGDEESLRQVNIVATENLLHSAVAHGCRDFLYISSISAIGEQPSQLADETNLPDLEEKRQRDPYGYSKLGAELLLQAYADNMRIIILNPSVILGPGSQRIAKILKGVRWVPVCPMITTLNSFVDVRDVAAAVVLALDQGRSGERYIVTTENIGMLPFMKLVMMAMGKKAPVFPVPKALLWLFDLIVWLLDRLHINPGLKISQGFNRNKAFCATKIRNEMGWRPHYSLAQTVQDTVVSIVGDEQDELVWQDGLAYRRV